MENLIKAVCRRDAMFGLVLALIVPLAAVAQDGPAQSARTGDSPALLTVFNRPIIVLRATVFNYSPAERVQGIEQRLSELIAQGKTKKLTTRQIVEGTVIDLDGELVMLITPGDVDPLSGETLEQAVRETMNQLQTALDLMNVQRSVGYLLRASGITLVATLLYVGFLWAARHIRVRLWILVARGREAISKSLGATGKTVLPQLLVFYQWAVRIIYWILVLGATDIWVTFSLRQFPYTAPWGEALGQHLIVMLRTLALGTVTALPDLFVVAVILLLTRLLLKLVRAFFVNVHEGRVKVGWLDRENAQPTGRIVTMVMWIFALVMIYPYLPGSGSAAFKGVGVFVGLLVSLGATGLISQVMGGFVLMYTRSIKVGEYVRTGEHEGTVKSIGFLSTRLRTRKNEIVNIPNAMLMAATTINYSRLSHTEGVMASTTVTIGYDAPWRQVHEMLLRAADKTAGLKKPPEPFVWQRSLSDFYVQYELNVCLDDPWQRLPVLSDLCANIQDEFNEHGVQIMSPHFRMNPPEKVWVPKEKWHEPPASRE